MLREESLLIKNYKIYQDSDLYCFTSDSVLISKFAKVKRGDRIADFCSGSGIVGLHLYALNDDQDIKSVHLFEMQSCMHDLAVKTVYKNNLQDKFFPINVKLQDIGSEYNGYFSLIVVNPPYMPKKSDNVTQKGICKEEVYLSLNELISVSAKKLKFGGRIDMVHRADRLSDIFVTMKSNGIEPKKMQFISGSKEKEPYLVMVEGVKGGKSGLKVLNTIINKAEGIG